jgi:anti-sigma factor ChrR (cupin superfamily)
MPTTSHPDRAALYAFHSGGLTPAERETIEAHLHVCPACGRELAVLPDAPFVLLVREAVRSAAATDPTPLPGSLRKSDP